MTTPTLKVYQQTALNRWAAFARSAQRNGPALAFGEQVEHPCNPKLWAHKTEGRCLFGQIVKDRAGAGMSGQLDTLFA